MFDETIAVLYQSVDVLYAAQFCIKRDTLIKYIYIYSRAMKTQHLDIHQYLQDILDILSQVISGDFMKQKTDMILT